MNPDFLFSILGSWVLFSLLSAFVERVLIVKGYIRGNTIWLIIGSLILAIFKQADFKNSLYVYILFAAIAIPLLINRYDLSITIKKGKWWWKTDNSQ